MRRERPAPALTGRRPSLRYDPVIDLSAMRPFSQKGSLPCPSAEFVAREDAMYQLVRGLQEEKARNIESREEELHFTGGMLRLSWPLELTYGVLTPIRRGCIRLERGARGWTIRYEIDFREVVVATTGIVVVVSSFAVVNGAPLPLAVGLAILPLLLAAGNILLGVARFRALLRRCMWKAGGG